MTSFPGLTSLCEDDEDDIATVAWGYSSLSDSQVVKAGGSASVCANDRGDIAPIPWSYSIYTNSCAAESDDSILASERRITWAELQAAYQEAQAHNIANHRAAALAQSTAPNQHAVPQQRMWQHEPVRRPISAWLVFAMLVLAGLTGFVGFVVWQLAWRV